MDKDKIRVSVEVLGHRIDLPVEEVEEIQDLAFACWYYKILAGPLEERKFESLPRKKPMALDPEITKS